MSTQEEQEEGNGEGCLSVGDREWAREKIWNNRGIQYMHTCKLCVCVCVCARMYTAHARVCCHSLDQYIQDTIPSSSWPADDQS